MAQAHINRTAILGTAKAPLQLSEGPLASVQARLQKQEADTEDQFLKLAAAHFLLQAGAAKLTSVEHPQLPKLPEEDKQAISIAAAARLNQFLKEDGEGLMLKWALEQLREQNRILYPQQLPRFLHAATSKNWLQPYLPVYGKRALWLARQNKEWEMLFLENREEDNLWETGTLTERLAWLNGVRTQNPTQARELLQDTLSQENAQTRKEFIAVLQTRLSNNDLEFLEGLTTDKSQAVKSQVYHLLSQLEGSSVRRAYTQYAQKAVSIKEERSGLLLRKKPTLHLNKSLAYPPELAQYGIEEVSSQKGIPDQAWWLAQVLARLPVNSWPTVFSETTDKLIAALLAMPEAELYAKAMADNAVAYKSAELADALPAEYLVDRPDIIPMLSEPNRYKVVETIINKYRSPSKDPLPIIVKALATTEESLLPNSIIKAIINSLHETPAYLQYRDFRLLALKISASMQDWLENKLKSIPDIYEQRQTRNAISEMIATLEQREQFNRLLY
jgi:hypothetical protein